MWRWQHRSLYRSLSLFLSLRFLSPRTATPILSVSLTAEGSSLVPLPFGRSPFVHNGYSIPILFSPGYTQETANLGTVLDPTDIREDEGTSAETTETRSKIKEQRVTILEKKRVFERRKSQGFIRKTSCLNFVCRDNNESLAIFMKNISEIFSLHLEKEYRRDCRKFDTRGILFEFILLPAIVHYQICNMRK